MKTAIVTGITGGIGGAVAAALAERGYALIGLDMKPLENSPFATPLTYIQGSVAEKDVREQVVAAAKAAERVDVLVNAAGIAPRVRRDLLEMDEESYDAVMDINLKSATFLTKDIANLMLKNKAENGTRGFIVNISSCSSYTVSVNRGEYCISKAGMTMMTQLFAKRLAREGILVNEVCPGIIATGMTAPVKDKYDTLIEEGLVPLKRWGTPEDIAKAVMALCDGSLGFTTGMSLIADGGLHMRSL